MNKAKRLFLGVGLVSALLLSTVPAMADDGCVTVGGRGTGSGRAPARVDITWTNYAGADHYVVSRSGVSGGPYAPIGSTVITAYSDTAGLSNSTTYYYIVEPTDAGGTPLCQSNEAAIFVPAGR